MLIPIPLLPEFPSTNFTRIRTLVRMYPPMIIQRIGPEESLLAYLHKTPQATSQLPYVSTYITPVTPIVRVYQTMLIIHRTGQKALIANGTLEGTLARVDLANVVLQVGTDGVASLAAFMRTSKGLDTYS